MALLPCVKLSQEHEEGDVVVFIDKMEVLLFLEETEQANESLILDGFECFDLEAVEGNSLL